MESKLAQNLNPSYEKQKKAARTLKWANGILFGASLLFCGILASATVFATPSFVKMFKETGVSLPAITQVLLSVSPMTYGIIFSLLAGGLLVKELLISDRGKRFNINLASFIFFQLFLGFYILAIFMPLLQLLSKL